MKRKLIDEGRIESVTARVSICLVGCLSLVSAGIVVNVVLKYTQNLGLFVLILSVVPTCIVFLFHRLLWRWL